MWDQKLKQGDLAPVLGIQQTALSRKLRGERKWTLDELRTVARALNTTTSYLLGETENPRPGGPVGGIVAAGVGPAGIEPTTSTV
ncbi:helix-turn-helix domain-containing protein [Pseudoclavibacter sp. 8L]|uniref:helix-turn-helix domain-containing protein n=1 Tax=Pseudoclavibacter sp. 8L TaxID=2653162 RepID=UPI003FA6E441